MPWAASRPRPRLSDGTTKSYVYTYDARGRLTDVTRDGSAWRHYDYDANGNRTGATEGTTSVTGDYDGQDRVLSYGGATFEHNAMGQRTSKTVGSDATTHDYDELGNLVEVQLPDTAITYVIDGLNRRVARKVDGTVTNRYLYGQGILPVAELHSDGSVKSRFVYASKGHVPDYMMKGATTYRFVTDQVGNVRLVVNTSDGTIAQRIDYDPFGKVLSDTNPGFQPFGFAGGLYDSETGLVRFGARDYDAQTGRWTAKDPILFEGGDTNLYAYVGSDPVNRLDPFGLDWLEDLNDSVGGLVDGLTTIQFTDFSLMGALRDHMVGGEIAVDVNVCSWGYAYANRIGKVVQAGLYLIVAGPATGSRWFKKNIFSFGRNSEGGPVITFFRGAIRRQSQVDIQRDPARAAARVVQQMESLEVLMVNAKIIAVERHPQGAPVEAILQVEEKKGKTLVRWWGGLSWETLQLTEVEPLLSNDPTYRAFEMDLPGSWEDGYLEPAQDSVRFVLGSPPKREDWESKRWSHRLLARLRRQ